LSISACGYEESYNSYYYCQKLNLNCIRENQVVTFRTSKGDFKVELFGNDNPVTTTNFIINVKNDIYRNKKFYKIINYAQLRVIHGGIGNNSENYMYSEKKQSFKKLPRSIPLEIKFIKGVDPKYNYQTKDPIETADLKITFDSGSLAMVKSGPRGSSPTEFFFVTNEIPELDGRYTVFGKIIKGIDVLGKIDKEDFIQEINISY